jgi:uncharacterized protein (UPF0210 family)
MKIRSITCFLNPGWPLDEASLQHCGAFAAAAQQAIAALGYEVETKRLATIPFPRLLPSLKIADVIALAKGLEEAASGAGFDYVSLGPALPERPESYGLIPDALAETQNVFLSGLMTTAGGGVALPAVRACAEVIHKAAGLTADGFGNLYFAALANVPPGAPFFPAAYHGEGGPACALATEAADLAVSAFEGATSLQAARQALVDAVEGHARRLQETAQETARAFGIAFAGIDFTLAPFPSRERSFGTALENLGVEAAGLHGSLAAAAILADTLDRADYPRAGFNGLMLPVLEDATLAQRAAEGSLSVKDLLMYSAVCGTGLDTVPLPGDTSVEALYAVLLDLACLAQRLDKPLTARLMPIPGKKAGDPTGFDFSYFANSRVMRLEARAMGGLLAGEETVRLRRRRI